MLELKLLGSPQILLHGRPVNGLPLKSQTLLFYLAVNGRPQSRLALAGLLWPDKREADALANLRQALYHLRNALPDYLEINRLTVAFNPALPCQIDVLLFEHGCDAANPLALRQAAVDRYVGDFLAGFYVENADPFDEWAVIMRERLHRLATTTLQDLVTHFVTQQETQWGLRYTNQWLALEPWREEAHCAKMRFLAWDGQRQAALDHYERCRQLLREELGAAPDAETVRLVEQIHSGQFDRVTTDAGLKAVAADGALLKPVPTVPIHLRRPVILPAELTGFVGRETELTLVQQRLADPACRLLTITGIGGVGKTRLALRTAHLLVGRLPHTPMPHFPDGIYYIPLAALEPHPQLEHLLATTVAAALGISLAGAATPTAQLLQALAEKALLLILDNCEHLPVAAFIHQLLQQTQAVKLLVTSRARLNVRGEHLIRLTGLTTPTTALPDEVTSDDLWRLHDHSAIRLFVQSVQAILPDFTLNATTAAPVVQICQLLHGLPLGIELAATWAQILSVPEIGQEIRQNLDFLANAQLDAPAQQRSLRAVFNHSWQRLTPTEQDALRRLIDNANQLGTINTNRHKAYLLHIYATFT
ncbi:MAG: AfsR/SARP family transcriptional regulator [Caldilineaceae bacterium]